LGNLSKHFNLLDKDRIFYGFMACILPLHFIFVAFCTFKISKYCSRSNGFFFHLIQVNIYAITHHYPDLILKPFKDTLFLRVIKPEEVVDLNLGNIKKVRIIVTRDTNNPILALFSGNNCFYGYPKKIFMCRNFLMQKNSEELYSKPMNCNDCKKFKQIQTLKGVKK